MKSIYTFLLMSMLIMTAAYAQQDDKQHKIDSLLQSLKQEKLDTSRVKTFIALARLHRFLNDSLSIDYGKKAVNAALRSGHRDAISLSYYSLANLYAQFNNDSAALRYYFRSLELETEKGDAEGMAALYTNIGSSYLSYSNYPKAIEYLLKALALFEKVKNKYGQAHCLLNISNVYYEQADYKTCIDYTLRAEQLYKSIGNKPGIALTIGNIGDCYAQMGQQEKAYTNFLASLNLYREVGDSSGVERNLANLGIYYQEKLDFEKALDKTNSAILISRTMGFTANIAYSYSNLAGIYLAMSKSGDENPSVKKNGGSKKCLQLAKIYADSAITILDQLGDLQSLSSAYKSLSEINKLSGDYLGALEAHQKFKQLNDSVFNIEKDKKITQSTMQYEFDKKEAAAKAEQEKKDIRHRNIRNSILAGLAGVLVFLIVVLRQRNKIKEGKKRSDELLLNILPEEVAEELKARGEAEAKQIDLVTVLFTDFKGFTAMSEQLTPKELVKDIHECFSAFDKIIEKYGIEKIKTIGDAYMAAGGLPTPNATHARDVVNAALEIAEFIEKGKAIKQAKHAPYFEIRIGVHTGPVVAGIVGLKKFAYDIWGDTVNTASRMESSGEIGKVNISESTYQLIRNDFNFDYRGEIEAKGKGKIKMYFVSRKV